jgi:hypothetical protein
MPGSQVRRQSGAETLVPAEPSAFMAHVRVCGGAGWATTGSTRKRTGGIALACCAVAQEQIGGGAAPATEACIVSLRGGTRSPWHDTLY